MPLDASLFAALGTRPKSVADYNNEANQQQANILQAQLGQIQLSQARQGFEDQNRLRQFLGGGADLSTPEGRAGLYRVAPTLAPKIIQGQVDLQKAQAETDLAKARTGTQTADAQAKQIANQKALLEHGILSLQTAQTPQEAERQVNDGVRQGYWSMQDAQQKLANIPKDPAQFAQWRTNQLRAVTDAYRQLPTIKTSNTGGATVTQAIDPFNGQSTVTGSIQNTASPDSVLSAETSRRNADVAAATSRDNNRATIQKDLTVAGVNTSGAPDQTVNEMAQMIADGKAPPLTGFAIAKPRGQAIMARVLELNPQYDATTYGAKAQAARAFTTGKEGGAMRSFQVADKHLEQLSGLADALDNKDTQLLNRLGNAFASQTGNPAPTNFEAVRDIASKEIIKAIVGAGGGVSERKEAADTLGAANSPAQLKGAIAQIRGLMSAQHDALLQQRRAAGLSDSTLPDYGAGHGAPSGAPSGWKYIGTTK